MKIISTNPSRNYEVIGEVEASTSEQVAQAVADARSAQPAWAALAQTERNKAVATFVALVEAHIEDIAKLEALETGRPIVSARADVRSGLADFASYLDTAESALQPEVTFETDSEIHRIYHEPRGVIAAICPWNFIFSNVAWQCGQALLAGNAIVYKNSEENPLFAELLARLIAQSKLPIGVFGVVYGDGKVGELLARSNIDMISFTGSLAVGKKLTAIAAEKFIPIVTELGGSSPCIVFADAELNDAALAYIYGRRFNHSGQFCTSVKRLIVHRNQFDEVVEKLAAILDTKKLGDALDESTDHGPLVAERQAVRLAEQVQDAIDRGAKVIRGGKRPTGLKGAYYEPTILTDVSRDMRVWKEETFGPVLPVLAFETEEEAIQLANDTIYGLGAHVFTSDKDCFTCVARQLQSGMVAENCVSYFDPRNPFGGYKQSGMGRENGEAGFHEVTQIKLISESN
jgi:acyl-CoA reductase-like NAD-dependent aldehyde dehydrogenase